MREHRCQLRRRQPLRAGEEAAREDLKGEVPRRDREIDVGQERLGGVEVVEPVVDVGHRHRGQRGGGKLH